MAQHMSFYGPSFSTQRRFAPRQLAGLGVVETQQPKPSLAFILTWFAFGLSSGALITYAAMRKV